MSSVSGTNVLKGYLNRQSSAARVNINNLGKSPHPLTVPAARGTNLANSNSNIFVYKNGWVSSNHKDEHQVPIRNGSNTKQRP